MGWGVGGFWGVDVLMCWCGGGSGDVDEKEWWGDS